MAVRPVILGLLSLVLLPLAAGDALAAPLPAPKEKKIAIPGQIAGVRLGMSLPAVIAAWGDPGTCSGMTTYATCTWGDAFGSTGMIIVSTGSSGKVEEVVFTSRHSLVPKYHLIPSVAPELARIKSREGITIGTKLKKVTKRYPGGVKGVAGGGQLRTYEVSKGGSTMGFSALSSSRKIIGIGLKKSHVD